MGGGEVHVSEGISLVLCLGGVMEKRELYLL